jgi:DNA-binding transcriptional MerR regulator
MSSRIIKIGEAAKMAGVSPDTLRYYERMGLLTPIARTQAGYRQYSQATVERIRFVRNALRFGFSLKQVAGFMRARDSGRAPCREVRAAAVEILARVDQRIKDLKEARRVVTATIVEWDQRLKSSTAGQRVGLLQGLEPDRLPTDCLSVRLKRTDR